MNTITNKLKDITPKKNIPIWLSVGMSITNEQYTKKIVVTISVKQINKFFIFLNVVGLIQRYKGNTISE